MYMYLQGGILEHACSVDRILRSYSTGVAGLFRLLFLRVNGAVIHHGCRHHGRLHALGDLSEATAHYVLRN